MATLLARDYKHESHRWAIERAKVFQMSRVDGDSLHRLNTDVEAVRLSGARMCPGKPCSDRPAAIVRGPAPC